MLILYDDASNKISRLFHPKFSRRVPVYPDENQFERMKRESEELCQKLSFKELTRRLTPLTEEEKQKRNEELQKKVEELEKIVASWDNKHKTGL